MCALSACLNATSLKMHKFSLRLTVDSICMDDDVIRCNFIKLIVKWHGDDVDKITSF